MKHFVKPFVNLHFWKFYFSFGWFKGEPFNVFQIKLGEVLTDYNDDKVDQIELFHIQSFRFIIAFGILLWK